MMLPSGSVGPNVSPLSRERLIPAACPSHDTNTSPPLTPPPAHGLSGALWMARFSDQVAPLSAEVIKRICSSPYSWQTAYKVPPPSTATAGSPMKLPVVSAIETFSLQVTPLSVVTENAHTRSPRSSIQPAMA